MDGPQALRHVWINLLSFLVVEKESWRQTHLSSAWCFKKLAVRHYTYEYIIIISHGDTCTTSRDDDDNNGIDVKHPTTRISFCIFNGKNGATKNENRF